MEARSLTEGIMEKKGAVISKYVEVVFDDSKKVIDFFLSKCILY